MGNNDIFEKIGKLANDFGKDVIKYANQLGTVLTGSDDDSTIVLYDFINSYQKLYQEFKEEYNNLDKLNIGENNNVIEYIDNGDFRLLSLQLNNQEVNSIVPSGEYNRLIIREIDGVVSAAFSNGASYNSKVEPLTGKNIDPRVLRDYLDLFGKYYPLFEIYRDSRLGGSIHKSDTISFRIDAHNESLINGLDDMEVFIDTKNPLGGNYRILIHADLTDGVKINYGRSIVKVDNTTIPIIPNQIIDATLWTTKLNRSYLRNYNIDHYLANNNAKQR